MVPTAANTEILHLEDVASRSEFLASDDNAEDIPEGDLDAFIFQHKVNSSQL